MSELPPPVWTPMVPPGQPEPEPTPAPSRRARSAIPAVAAAVLAALALVAAAWLLPGTLGQHDDGAAGLRGLRTYDDLATSHVGERDIDYPQAPPVGGPHADAWMECGVYDEPLREENVVHDLEHGTVVVNYDPDLSDDDVASLADLLPDNGILAPYPGLRAPVVVTVWGRQLDLDGADDPRLPAFLREFGGGVTAPEPMASCAGGLTESPPDGLSA